MTDIDNSTGEVVEETRITTIGAWADRMRHGYAEMAHKTVPAILEFGAEVKAFHEACEVSSGGSTFTEMMKLWVGFTPSTSSRWLSIGHCDKLLRSAQKLPASWYSISLLTQLPNRKYNECVKDGRINPLMTRKEAKELKPESTRKSPISKVRPAEDLYQERLKSINNTLSMMTEGDRARVSEEIGVPQGAGAVTAAPVKSETTMTDYIKRMESMIQPSEWKRLYSRQDGIPDVKFITLTSAKNVVELALNGLIKRDQKTVVRGILMFLNYFDEIKGSLVNDAIKAEQQQIANNSQNTNTALVAIVDEINSKDLTRAMFRIIRSEIDPDKKSGNLELSKRLGQIKAQAKKGGLL